MVLVSESVLNIVRPITVQDWDGKSTIMDSRIMIRWVWMVLDHQNTMSVNQCWYWGNFLTLKAVWCQRFLDDAAGDHGAEDHDEAEDDEHDAQVEGGHHGLWLVWGRPQRSRPGLAGGQSVLLQGAGAGHALALGAHQTGACVRMRRAEARGVTCAALAPDLGEPPLVPLLPLRPHSHRALDRRGQRHPDCHDVTMMSHRAWNEKIWGLAGFLWVSRSKWWQIFGLS